jgi:uncharacterized protein (DUF433 family)
MKASVIRSDREIQGGVLVFVGTRVPVKNLVDCLEAGDSLGDLLKSFPSVTREQAVATLEVAREASTQAGTEARFRVRATRGAGKTQRALGLLEKVRGRKAG